MADTNAAPANEPAVQLIDAPGDAGSPNAEPNKRVEPQVDAAQVEALRRELTEVQQRNAQYEGVMDRLVEHPEFSKSIKPFLTGEGVQPTQEDHQALDAILSKITDDPEVKQGLQELFAAAGDAGYRKAKAETGSLASEVRSVRVTQAERAGLEAAGLDISTAQSKEFKDFAASFQKDNPWLASVRRDDPGAAVKIVAERFVATMDPSKLRAAQERIRTAKDTSLETKPGAGLVGASAGIPANAVRINRNSSTFVLELHEARKAGKPVAIVG